jgi:hypothetical protein
VRPGLDSRQGEEIFRYFPAFRLALQSTPTPIQLIAGALSLGVKRPGTETDHSPPSSAKVKNGKAIPPIPRMSSWRCA